jgi:beta-lactamase regulating signal transducer with metallopeptidase domain
MTSVADLDRNAGVVLDVLWRSSWQASVLAGVVLLVQFALRERIAARWRHALWAIVLLRLLIPVTPPSPWSLFNVAPHALPAPPVPAGIVTITHSLGPPLALSRQSTPPFWKLALATLWLIGLAWMLARIAWATLMLSLSVRRMKRVDDAKILSLLQRCRHELNVLRELQVLAAPTIAAPALMGFFKPRLLLPPAVIECFDADELRHILLHELAHLKRHDVAINWLASILQAVHWFNPVIWLALARLRSDRELAADELVLSLTAADAPPRDAYGNTLVKLLQTLSTPTTSQRGRSMTLSGTVGILERAHPMRRRITMIARFNGGNAKRWTLAAAACMLVLLGIGLTDAVRRVDAAAGPSSTTRPAAGTTAESPDVKREVDAALDALIKDMPITPQKIDAAARKIADDISKRELILAANGQVMNQAVVDAKVATVTDQVRRFAKQMMNAKPAPKMQDDQLQALLKKRLPELHFDAIALSDVIDFLRDITGANIYVNWRALEAAGIDRNTPISMRLRDVPFEQAMNQIVRDLSADGKSKAEYATDDGILVLSSQAELATHPQVQSFDVSDLLQPQDQGSGALLEKVVTAHVRGAQISVYHERLLAQGSPEEIRSVEKVLNALREKK